MYRISVRVATALVLATVLVATAAIYAVTTSGQSRHDRAREASDRALANSALYEEALGAAYSEWVTVIGYFLLQDPLYLERFETARANVESSLVQLRQDAERNAPEDVALLNEFIEKHDRFADTDAQIIDQIRDGDIAGAITIAIESGLFAESDAFLGSMRLKIAEQREEVRAAQAAQNDAQTTTLNWSLAIGAMSGGLLIIIAIGGVLWIGRPILRASAATRAIAAGDLTARVPRSGPAELATLADNVNAMAEALIHRSDELNAYLAKDLESRTAALERANADLAREVDERKRAEESLARTLEVERELEEQLRHQAFHDPLTGLANRARFVDRLEHALQRAARGPQLLAVLFMDLDDFKSVNDSLGHQAGDHLLIDVAARLATNSRPGDTSARLGGDEFAILLDGVLRREDAVICAERILESLKAPFTLEEKEVFVRASMGIVVGSGGQIAEELLRRADVAMYAAKSDGKGRFAIYDETMETSMVGRLQLASELQRAVERSELVLHYQPSVVLSSGRIVGMEALLRWQHPARGLLPPADFITLAEETGLILPIGEWVLRQACMQTRRWQLEHGGEPPLSIAVNVSARQIHQPELVTIVADALRESELPPECLVLEITETLVMQDAERAIARLNELKALGVRLAIDDFGTGYSSLSYLRRFPVDILKIDKSFVDGVSRHGKERELAQSIIELGRTLHLEIVAEGVESEEQLGWLQSRDCDLAQGFLFSEPLAPDEIGRMLGEIDSRDVA